MRSSKRILDQAQSVVLLQCIGIRSKGANTVIAYRFQQDDQLLVVLNRIVHPMTHRGHTIEGPLLFPGNVPCRPHSRWPTAAIFQSRASELKKARRSEYGRFICQLVG